MYISILLPKMSSLHSTNHQLVLAKWNIDKERVLAKTVKKNLATLRCIQDDGIVWTYFKSIDDILLYITPVNNL